MVFELCCQGGESCSFKQPERYIVLYFVSESRIIILIAEIWLYYYWFVYRTENILKDMVWYCSFSLESFSEQMYFSFLISFS